MIGESSTLYLCIDYKEHLVWVVFVFFFIINIKCSFLLLNFNSDQQFFMQFQILSATFN